MLFAKTCIACARLLVFRKTRQAGRKDKKWIDALDVLPTQTQKGADAGRATNPNKQKTDKAFMCLSPHVGVALRVGDLIHERGLGKVYFPHFDGAGRN